MIYADGEAVKLTATETKIVDLFMRPDGQEACLTPANRHTPLTLHSLLPPAKYRLLLQFLCHKKGMNDSGKKDRGIICDISVFFVQDAMIHYSLRLPS